MYERTPLIGAATFGHREVFELVVDKGGNTAFVDINDNNILHLACLGGHVEMVKYILSQKIADINSRGMYERTPLIGAATFGHREVFELVVDKGGNTAFVDINDNNILHLACLGGHVEMVKYILSQKIADINSRGMYERTPLIGGATFGHREVFELVVDKRRQYCTCGYKW
ncbi:ankyrin repeat domain-containing protein 50-like [Haliotis rufescens]|uniref:ankyrin repeat domain-containing protein 50-like n=1 Tax=Haliotis rufescens TaxID=6454 RepID=UPI00201F6748|nr:ankyrin repeat domain-containing protein 50-like [Haliotis rufescens]